MKPTDFSIHLTNFLSRYLPGERGMSQHTISSYRFTFILFISFIEQVKKIGVSKLVLRDITKEIVVEFLDWLQSERRSSSATRNVRLAALHSFFSFMQYKQPDQMEEWQRILAIKVKKTAKNAVSYLSIDGLKLLLEQPDIFSHKGRRDLSMLALMYDCAARVQEIIDAEPSFIRLDKPYTMKIIGKGSKARIVPLMDEAIVHIRKYMDENNLLAPHLRTSPLFFNSRGEKLTRAGVNSILKKYACMARNKNPGLIPEKISCHSLGHSKAMHLLQAGVHLVYIRDFLGHESVQTTEIYARADSQQKREAIEKAYVDVITKEIPEWVENHDLLQWLKAFR
ncbi:site-specific recombinase XerD [Sphingobacterium alimentarium]|uniref:Site-specific recombinase XerD n=1 Tax=Sphingobacterium alimentarium TaxID=797292 RepID=A0A4R3VZ29_9SPHI|nr:site-specific integrase [Sphingobacterium alimentarium]TCV19584.1 site-specific recombinase XerD [Sphingobacterium alimentarium]